MATHILSSAPDAEKLPARFDAGNPMGDIAMMLVAMDRAGRLKATERDSLRLHARSSLHSLPVMIRGVAVALIDAIHEGNFERHHIGNAVWSIDMMADALQGMQILADDLSTPAEAPNHA